MKLTKTGWFSMAILFMALIAFLGEVVAQRNSGRRPTPDEADWNAGVYDYTYSTSTNNNQAIATRGGRFTTDTNFIVITNAGVTTNAFISVIPTASTGGGGAGPDTNNWVTGVIASNGTFRVNLYRVPTNVQSAFKYFILNY